MEINASDERSAGVLTERVYRAMESTTINMGGSGSQRVWSSSNQVTYRKLRDFGKPNCLILDEVDGADAKGAVAAIVELIRAEMPPPRASANFGNAGSGKKQSSKKYLRRPIIFICNQKYAPALRPLLPYCRQFNVHPPTASRLVSRLQAVLRAENLVVSGGSSLLHQLVSTSGGDIRNCLHTLQFSAASVVQANGRRGAGDDLREKHKNDIAHALKVALGNGPGGLKDERNDLAGTVTTVFRKSKERQQAGGLNRIGERSVNRVLKRGSTARIFNCVEGFGDCSKTIDALFLNLLRVSYIDPTMDRCAVSHEWLSGIDMFRSSNLLTNTPMEQYGMQRLYMPTSVAAIHLLCSVELRSDLIFTTRQLSDARYQQESNQTLVQKFAEGFPPQVSSSRCIQLLSTETIPYAMWLLSAGDGNSSLTRPASSIDMLKPKERALFDDHVGKLRSLGLTYISASDQAEEMERDEANQTSFNKSMRLEPPIERLVRYREVVFPPGLKRTEIPATVSCECVHAVVSNHT